MKKKKLLKEPIFKTETLYLIGYSHEELSKELEKRGLEIDKDYFKNADGGAITEMDLDEPLRCIWIRDSKITPELLGTLAHEITHHVLRILDWKGIPVTVQYNADETMAYLVDYYMRNAISLITGNKLEY